MIQTVHLPTLTHSITLSCPTSSTTDRSLSKTNIVMAPIDSDIEAAIDQGLSVKIPISNNKTIIVSPSKVLTYGDVNFNNDNDLDLFDRLNLKIDAFSGYSIPSNYDYEHHTCDYIDYKPKYYQTWDNIKIIKFKHACLGKPKKIIVFKHCI